MRLVVATSVLALGQLLLASAGSPSSSVSAAGWSGTVKVVEDVSHTFDRPNNNPPGTTTITYHDEAVYTLTGETTPDGLQVARMTGSGQGRASGTYPPCTVTYDPWLQWSYDGEAAVRVSYTGGRFVVEPQAVTTTFTNLRGGCGTPDLTQTSQLPAPEGIVQIHPQGMTAGAGATSLSGTETFPLSFVIANVSEDAGTATMTWSLTGGSPQSAHCVVPRLVGKKLAAARQALAKAACGVGRVTGRKSARVAKGRVISQTPRAGLTRPKGTKVSLVVSTGT